MAQVVLAFGHHTLSSRGESTGPDHTWVPGTIVGRVTRRDGMPAGGNTLRIGVSAGYGRAGCRNGGVAVAIRGQAVSCCREGARRPGGFRWCGPVVPDPARMPCAIGLLIN